MVIGKELLHTFIKITVLELAFSFKNQSSQNKVQTRVHVRAKFHLNFK